MASAVLPCRNEPHWGERKVYMRKYAHTSSNKPHFKNFNQTCPNRNPNSNPGPFRVPTRKIHDVCNPHPLEHDEQASRRSPEAAASAANDSPYWKTNNHHREYLIFNLAAYSRSELKELERRLRSELEQVRSLRAQIENETVKYGSGHLGSHFSAGYGGCSAAPSCPPLLQLDFAFESSNVDLSRENLTPLENQNKKNALGNKRPIPLASDRDSKRHATISDSKIFKLFTSIMKRCHQILVKLMKHKFGWVFNTPVDVISLGLHDYNRVIKNPMDLGTVKSKLDKKEYKSPLGFASDVRLTFDNARTYNPKGSDVYMMAETLLCLFEKLFASSYMKFEAQQRLVISANQIHIEEPRDVNSKEFVPMLVQESLLNPMSDQVVGILRTVQKLPKPDASDPNKRQMNLEEKSKLGSGLQNLPVEKMDAMLEIISKRNSHMTPEGDELELDIEALDVETLWELDTLVGNHKAENKMMQQGVPNTIKSSPVREQMPETDSKTLCDTLEEDVDIGEDIPVNIFPPVEIEKDDSCRSSCRRDSSSSSGSDSSSSSDSDSEEDSVQSPFVESKEGEAT